MSENVWVVTRDVYDGEGLGDPADEYVGVSASAFGALCMAYEDGGPPNRTASGLRQRYHVDTDAGTVVKEAENEQPRTFVQPGAIPRRWWTNEGTWHIRQDVLEP